MNDLQKQKAKRLIRKYGPTVLATYVLTTKIKAWQYDQGMDVRLPKKIVEGLLEGRTAQLTMDSGDIFVLHRA